MTYFTAVVGSIIRKSCIKVLIAIYFSLGNRQPKCVVQRKMIESNLVCNLLHKQPCFNEGVEAGWKLQLFKII